MRTLLLGLVLLTISCRRPSTQFAAMMTPVNQPIDYRKNLKAGDELIAMGTDPAWSLTLNPSKGFLKFKPSTSDSLTTKAPDIQTDSEGVLRLSALVDSAQSGRIIIVFKPDSCVDKLSGQRYDYRVEVDYRGKTYTGCGVSLRQLTLLQDIWVLTRFQGKAITATESRREVPRLEISLTEGRVTGTTGCNRLSGTIMADTQKLLFGPLITTKMACLGESGEFEPKFLHELTEPLAYRVGDGKLTLLRAGNEVMAFKKVD